MASTTPNEQFTTVYGAKVKQAYQSSMVLTPYVRSEMIKGEKQWFPVMADGEAQERIPGTRVQDMGNKEGGIFIYVKDYDASKYVAKEDLDKLTYNQIKEYATLIGNACGRRGDQVNIDAWNLAVHAEQKVPIATGSDTEFNYDKVLEILALFDARGVPTGDRCVALTTTAATRLLEEERFTSSDYQSMQPVKSGMVGSALGLDFIPINERKEGGLPKKAITGNAGNQQATRTHFAFHKDALGHVSSAAMKNSTDWIPELKSTLVTTDFSAGAGVIDQGGLISIETTERYIPYKNFIGERT